MLLFLWSPSSSHLQIFVEDFRGFVLGEYSTLNHVSGPSEAGDRFEHQGIFTKYTELFCEIQQFNHTQGRLLLTQASCRQHRLVKASFGRACPKRCRQTQEPSCSLCHWMQASSGLEDVTAPDAMGLGMLTWAQCCRQRSCALLAPICLKFFFFFPFPEFPLTSTGYRKEKPSALLGSSSTEINPWNKIGSQIRVNPWPPLFLPFPPNSANLYYSWTLFNSGSFFHSQ